MNVDSNREVVRRRRALNEAITGLLGVANLLQAARSGNDRLRDAVLDDARRSIESKRHLLAALE